MYKFILTKVFRICSGDHIFNQYGLIYTYKITENHMYTLNYAFYMYVSLSMLNQTYIFIKHKIMLECLSIVFVCLIMILINSDFISECKITKNHRQNFKLCLLCVHKIIHAKLIIYN